MLLRGASRWVRIGAQTGTKCGARKPTAADWGRRGREAGLVPAGPTGPRRRGKTARTLGGGGIGVALAMGRDEERACYEYPVHALGPGSSLGSQEAFVVLDRESNLETFWCSDGHYYSGSLRVDLVSQGVPLLPESTQFWPDRQVTLYRGPGVTVRKAAYLVDDPEDPRRFVLEIRAEVHHRPRASLRALVRFRPVPHAVEQQVKQPPRGQQERRVRVEWVSPDRLHVVAEDNPEVYTALLLPVPPAEWHLTESQRLTLLLDLPLPQEGEATWDLQVAARPMPARVRATPAPAGGRLESVLQEVRVHLPDPLLSRAWTWAVTNTVRVQHRFPAGWGFTNNPPDDILVVRDAAWYAMGADWITPDFTRRMLDAIVTYGVDESGKAVEFLRMSEVPPAREDYRLSLNDDTPLLVLALVHHALVSADETFRSTALAAARRLGAYLLAQMRDGLLWSRASGTNVFGIASWRNIIPGYRLDGAVTEINAEAYAAWCSLAELAAWQGDEEEASQWRERAESLRAAIDRHLYDPAAGRYLLARGHDGRPRGEVTGDMVFPALFQVADPVRARRIVERLFAPDFWTEHGLRTVSTQDPDHDPRHGYGLLGGVWPNVTLWLAMAAASYAPERSVEVLRLVARQIEPPVPAQRGRVTPGEFPEWFDGVTGESLGMVMSPWVPPTFVWVMLEGVVGLTPARDGLRLSHPLPASLGHVCLSGLPFRGRRVHAVVTPGLVLADVPIATEPGVRAEPFESARPLPVDGPGWALVLVRGGEAWLALGAKKAGTLRVLGPDGLVERTLEAGEVRVLAPGVEQRLSMPA